MSSRQGYQPYGKCDWVAAFKQVYKKEGHVSTRYLQHNYPLIYQQGTWIFSDWDKALRAAGFDPRRMRMRTVWDRKKVVRGIRRMRKRSLPVYASYVLKNHKSLFSGAERQFGSWSKALLAAGVNKMLASGMANGSRRLLPRLRDALDSKAGVSEALRLHAEHYFGSLQKAIIAAKNDPKGWSKKRITSMLSKMHRSKTLPAYARARRECLPLVSAAEAYFGSWGKALFAAGIDPHLYFVHHRWRKTGTD
jgi:hypothetical protein